VRIVLLLGRRNGEAEILLREVRWSAGRSSAGLFEWRHRPWSIRRLPATQVIEPAALQPELDSALAPKGGPRVVERCRGPRLQAKRDPMLVDQRHRARNGIAGGLPLGFDEPHLPAGGEIDRRVLLREFHLLVPGHAAEAENRRVSDGLNGVRRPLSAK